MSYLDSQVKVVFDEKDITIVERPKSSHRGLVVKFVVVVSTRDIQTVLPSSVISDFISHNGVKLAGYRVVSFDGKDEPPAPGSQTKKKANNATTKYIVGCGVLVGLIALVVLVLIVKRLVVTFFRFETHAYFTYAYSRRFGLGRRGPRDIYFHWGGAILNQFLFL